MRSLDVGVIGGGTAGSAAALFLARAGHRVTIYERVPSPTAVGAGITIQPTGLHVLARLGLYDAIVERGARVDRLRCENAKRQPICELTYAECGEDFFGVGLHRGVLFEALFGAVQREPRVTLRAGVEIADLARAEPARVGARSRWSWLVGPDGERYGPHELVVVADGARSQLRDDTSTSKRVEPYPWGALWFVGTSARSADDPMARTLHQVVDGNHTFLGLLPTGLLPRTHERAKDSGPLVSLFWSIRCDRVEAWRERGVGRWKDDVRRLAKEADPVLEQIEDQSQMLFAVYHDVVMHRWHARNVVYLGDAAHAMSPQLGQGCNLALWDAMELADCLASGETDLAEALASYSRRRADHLAFYQFATRWLTPFFQGDQPVLGPVRDVGMSLMTRVPLFRRVMTTTMLGVVDGFLGRTCPLKLPTAGAPSAD